MSSKQTQALDNEVRKLVIARLRSFPSGRKMSIGSSGEFTKDELIERIQKDDDIGQKILQVQLNYLQSLKNEQFLGE